MNWAKKHLRRKWTIWGLIVTGSVSPSTTSVLFHSAPPYVSREIWHHVSWILVAARRYLFGTAGNRQQMCISSFLRAHFGSWHLLWCYELFMLRKHKTVKLLAQLFWIDYFEQSTTDVFVRMFLFFDFIICIIVR